MRRNTLGAAALTAVLAVAASSPGAVSFDFDSPADLAGFVETVTTADRYVYDAGPGIGGISGFLAVNQPNFGSTAGESSHYYTLESFDASVDDVSARVFFRASATTGNGNSRQVLGLGNAVSGSYANLATSGAKLAVRVFKDTASPADWQFQFVNGVATRDIGGSFSLTENNWYQLDLTVGPNQTAGLISFTASLIEYEADGITPTGLTRFDSDTSTLLTTYDLTQLFVGTLGQNLAGGATAFDNLVATAGLIPEPASLSLLALGGLALRRRR